eukprot:TRINITY_DN7888_c0_g1_i7.p2 TRINITY_DN7888_c0_g1~~TRINITY_DN7888_c0_g1_i7.p2  ORF type:complete len:123 (-),score=14.76 TRINITY_DN7888_c0_g1_i7:104-472(-)
MAATWDVDGNTQKLPKANHRGNNEWHQQLTTILHSRRVFAHRIADRLLGSVDIQEAIVRITRSCCASNSILLVRQLATKKLTRPLTARRRAQTNKVHCLTYSKPKAFCNSRKQPAHDSLLMR